MAIFGIRVSGVDFVAISRVWAESWIITVTLGPAAMGLFNIAQRLVQVAQELTAASLVPVSTVVFAKVRESQDRLRGTYVKALGVAYAVVSPLMILIVVTAPVMVPTALWREVAGQCAPGPGTRPGRHHHARRDARPRPVLWAGPPGLVAALLHRRRHRHGGHDRDRGPLGPARCRHRFRDRRGPRHCRALGARRAAAGTAATRGRPALPHDPRADGDHGRAGRAPVPVPLGQVTPHGWCWSSPAAPRSSCTWCC